MHQPNEEKTFFFVVHFDGYYNSTKMKPHAHAFTAEVKTKKLNIVGKFKIHGAVL